MHPRTTSENAEDFFYTSNALPNIITEAAPTNLTLMCNWKIIPQSNNLLILMLFQNKTYVTTANIIQKMFGPHGWDVPNRQCQNTEGNNIWQQSLLTCGMHLSTLCNTCTKHVPWRLQSLPRDDSYFNEKICFNRYYLIIIIILVIINICISLLLWGHNFREVD